ncbi:hypothetical protein A3I45_02085 [Candidatus Uhrbacteria bacterium RIFCSPLOWO2_02_FULL_53_10]|uniref:Glycosyltransferase subfamily 4-like N-terminal domain-containing protein n=1 Tax=Candidatus Uhrbacteria bacterium RIFCSPLOWO2_02_FULL_53_10 TaxID=1802411 RepID=A0A1F7VH65_9BACT|nr:MAG: hypothetical protein A3I45_02085 [Candidatus Uhrbacteria bacterium RIFCSPLOWO2_02_FULL_53_10]
MKVAVNATPAVSMQKTGVEYYTDALLRALMRIAPDADVDICAPRSWNTQLPSVWRMSTLLWPFPGWSTFRFSSHLLKTRPDIVFVPGNALPPVSIGKQVTTVHDLAFQHCPELYTPAQIKEMQSAHRRAADNANHIITISDVTKRDMAEHFGVEETRMTTVHLGIDHERFCVRSSVSPDVVRVKTAHQLTKPYLLFIGRVEQKKGIDTLARAYMDAQLHEQGVELVLAGYRGAHVSDELRTLLKQPSVRELGYVSDADIGPMLSGALAFAFPTRKEGFGMPVLEAMASGVPVVCSDLQVLREIASDYPTYIPVDDVVAWANALCGILRNTQQTRQDDAITHAKSFTWDRCARQTWDVLSRVTLTTSNLRPPLV